MKKGFKTVVLLVVLMLTLCSCTSAQTLKYANKAMVSVYSFWGNAMKTSDIKAVYVSQNAQPETYRYEAEEATSLNKTFDDVVARVYVEVESFFEDGGNVVSYLLRGVCYIDNNGDAEFYPALDGVFLDDAVDGMYDGLTEYTEAAEAMAKAEWERRNEYFLPTEDEMNSWEKINVSKLTTPW